MDLAVPCTFDTRFNTEVQNVAAVMDTFREGIRITIDNAKSAATQNAETA